MSDKKEPINRIELYNDNGSGIQPEQPEIDYSHPATPLIAEIKSKSVQKRLAVQKPEHKCLSCSNIITTGDYCSECSDTPDGRSKQVEDIMDFVEPEEYLKTEDEKIREVLQHSGFEINFIATDEDGTSHKLEFKDNINSGAVYFSCGGLNYIEINKSRQQEIEDLKEDATNYNLAIDGFIIQLSEKDKQIEKSNFLREEALYKYSSLTDKYCNLVDQNIELKEQVRELKKVKPYIKTIDI